MSLQTRILLLVTSLLMTAVIGTTAILTWTTQQAMHEQTDMDGQALASLLARSAGFASEVPEDVEHVIGDQMVVSARLTAYLLAVAEEAGYSPDEIIAIMRDVTNSTVLSEMWLTDETGHAYIATAEGIDFTFSPDIEEQPQAGEFWPLITGEVSTVVQRAQKREIDDGQFKYVGVGGVDQPRIIQLGTSVEVLDQIASEMGPARLVDEIVASGRVSSIHVVDRNFTTIAYGGIDPDMEQEWLRMTPELWRTLSSGGIYSQQSAGTLDVIAPIMDSEDQMTGAVMVTLPSTQLDAALRANLRMAILVAGVVMIIGGMASVALARWVTNPVERLTLAAAAVEANTFDPASIDGVAHRRDGLGRLARLFQKMAQEIQAREARLRAQLQEMRIEVDRAQEARQVAEIVETDYFQSLQAKAKDLRKRSATPASRRNGD